MMSSVAWSTIQLGLLSNLPTAIVAVVLGIPAGLSINRRFSQWQTRGSRERLRTVILGDLHAKREVLKRYERDLAALRWGEPSSGTLQLNVPPMDDGLWRALQSSGDLHTLSSEEIASIGAAYEAIVGVGILESKMLEQMTYLGPRWPGNYPDLYQLLRDLIAEGLTAISDCFP